MKFIEKIEVWTNILAGASPDGTLQCSKVMSSRENDLKDPCGNGKARERIVEILERIEKILTTCKNDIGSSLTKSLINTETAKIVIWNKEGEL